MPIVDGLTATKMIRSFEKTSPAVDHEYAAGLNRVTIFGVSASLVERNRQVYMDAGFDGWIPKPIDFKRLNTLFAAITDVGVRKECAYKPGQWESGGWFQWQPSTVQESNTRPEAAVREY
jgi:CheY-like chemotaxis protein